MKLILMTGFVWKGGISHSCLGASISPEGSSKWISPPLL